MTISVVTSVSTVGSKKQPPCAARLPPVTTLAPFLTASVMCASPFDSFDEGANRPVIGRSYERSGAIGTEQIYSHFYCHIVGRCARVADELLRRECFRDRPVSQKFKSINPILRSASLKECHRYYHYYLAKLPCAHARCCHRFRELYRRISLKALYTPCVYRSPPSVKIRHLHPLQ